MFLFSVRVDSLLGLIANSAVLKITENTKDSVTDRIVILAHKKESYVMKV